MLPDDGRHEVLPRVETGPVQFEDDWRGVFIRGDDALLEFRPALLRFLALAPELTDYASLESLAALLGRANHYAADEGLQTIWRAEPWPGAKGGV